MKWLSPPLFVLLLFNCAFAEVTQDSDGWTVVTPSADTVMIYVSDSQGDDSNDGYTEQTPVKTIAKAYSLLRNDHPDWMLLKAGDDFDDQWLGRDDGYWEKSGRSAEEPLLITSYGSGPRPRVMPKGQPALRNEQNGPNRSFIFIIGIELYNRAADPESEHFEDGVISSMGLRWREAGSDYLIENCKIHSFGFGLEITNRDETQQTHRWTIRRSVICDNRSQAALLVGHDDFLIEECVIDHCGWRMDRNWWAPKYGATMKKHNLYVTNINMNRMVVRDNLIMRASSHGIHFRPGGTLEGNVFVACPIPIEVGYPNNHLIPEGVDSIIRNNVVLHSNDIAHKQYRGWGISIKNTRSALVEDNLILGVWSRFTNTYGIQLFGLESYPTQGVVLRNNIIYDWDRGWPHKVQDPEYTTIAVSENNGWYKPPSVEGTDYDSSKVNWVNPNVDIGTYHRSIGEAARLEDFCRRAREQSKTSWKAEYTAPVVRQYFKNAFTPQP